MHTLDFSTFTGSVNVMILDLVSHKCYLNHTLLHQITVNDNAVYVCIYYPYFLDVFNTLIYLTL